jgi:hypothetical protein
MAIDLDGGLVLAARRAERLEATRVIVEQPGRRAITVAADVALPVQRILSRLAAGTCGP